MRKNKKFIYAFLLSLSISILGITACTQAVKGKTGLSENMKEAGNENIDKENRNNMNDKEAVNTGVAEELALADSGIEDEDYNDKANDTAVEIKLESDKTEIDVEGASFENSVLTISKAGTYILSGTLKGGIAVSVADEEKVQLILNGVSIEGKNGAAISMNSGEKLILTLAEGTTNTLSDASEYIYAENEDEPDAAIFAKNNLTINGSGVLNVSGNYAGAMKAKGNLIIVSGDININSKDNAIKGKDLVVVADGDLDIEAVGKGITSEGSVYIYKGRIDITNSEEGLEGKTVEVYGGDISINSTDDGINARIKADDSLSDEEKERLGKENQEGVYFMISGGNVSVNAEGDGIDSNGNVYITGGNIVVYGPKSGGNGTLDYNGEAIITGGRYIGFGMGEMVQTFSSNSTTGYVESITDTKSEAVNVSLIDSENIKIAEAASVKEFSHILIAGEGISNDKTYILQIGNTSEEVTAKSGESDKSKRSQGGMPPKGNLNPEDMARGAGNKAGEFGETSRLYRKAGDKGTESDKESKNFVGKELYKNENLKNNAAWNFKTEPEGKEKSRKNSMKEEGKEENFRGDTAKQKAKRAAEEGNNNISALPKEDDDKKKKAESGVKDKQRDKNRKSTGEKGESRENRKIGKE